MASPYRSGPDPSACFRTGVRIEIHQDGTTLQLVPTDVHDAVRHAGGIALAIGRTK
ncbi:HNH endonuclease [Nocardioides albertanoniae]|uniref:HNH endonuclease n=1 Tax=Nocardioides albertanoniae TaxID=1175486 RepID=UPI0011525402